MAFSLQNPSWILDIVIFLIGVIGAFYANFKLRSRKYWANRNVLYEEPTFVLGNMKDVNYKITLTQKLENLYFKYKGKKVLGMYLYTKPTFLALDFEFIKDILVKDFSHFHDRGLAVNEELEPLTAHLLSMSGQKWRNLRVKLTPTFTSGKMKMMYETMYNVGVELQKFLEKPAADGATIEVKEIMACFTTDVIASCAFGLETNSMGNSESEFRKYGRMIFDLPPHLIISSIIQFVAPTLAKYLSLRQMPKVVGDYFMKAVKDVISYREKADVKRKDFLQLLIELKNKGNIEDADSKYHDNSNALAEGDPFTLEQAAAQAFVFFFAGFETSSTTLMFILYQLACHPEIQARLQTEIDEMLKTEGGQISYNAILELKYMDKVIEESMRIYPPVPTLVRECTKEYPIPGSDITIEKGEFVLIPIRAIHMDPEYFPDPERFDPDRFSAEAKAGRDSMLNLSFGAGPRICIGVRFGLLQVKVGLVMIFSKYNIEVAEKTPIPMDFDPKMFIPSPKNGMPLKITKRSYRHSPKI